jgi:hypothetical protein
MRGQRPGRGTDTAVVGGGSRPGDDLVSSADRRISCRPFWRAGKLKKKITLFGILAVLLLLAAAYVWGPSSVSPGQASLLTLTAANFSEFEKSFDADSDDPRLVLLLSPT